MDQTNEEAVQEGRRFVVYGGRKITQRSSVGAIILVHFLADAFFFFCCLYMLARYPDARTDETGRKEWPLLVHFTLSILVTGFLGKAYLLLKLFEYSPQRLHCVHWQVCILQILAAQLVLTIELGYYKCFLVDLGSYFQDVQVVEKATLLMQVYVFMLNFWGAVELFSFLSFYLKNRGDISNGR